MTVTNDDVLVIIDVQRAFGDPTSPWCAEGFDSAFDGIKRLHAAFDGQTVWTRFVYDPREPGAWHDYYQAWPQMRRPPDDHMWELLEVPESDDHIVTAHSFSKWGVDLAELVPQDARMVLCGVATDCCVIATAFGAVDAGRRVLLVADACAGGTRRQHEQALEVMAQLAPMLQIVTVGQYVDNLTNHS